MTNDTDENFAFPPAAIAARMQEASNSLTAKQLEWFEEMMTGRAFTNGAVGGLGAMSMGTAVFKSRVQSGGRISIPDAERDALDIEEGDLVQVFIIPLTHGDTNE